MDAGKNEYFAELVRRYGKGVERCCQGFVRDPAQAEDLAQETFTRAFSRFHQFHGGSIQAWIFTIARSVCLNYIKSPQARAVAAIEDPDVMKSPSDFVGDLMKKAEVRAVLARLSAEQRICLKLFYIEGLSAREIVAATGYTDAEVKTYLQNGRRRFEIEWKKREQR